MEGFNISFEVVTLIVTISLAFLGYFFSYFNNLRLTRRKERLDLINNQLNDFYGPLYVLTRVASNVFWKLKKRAEIRGFEYIDDDAPKTENDISEWRIYVEDILVPRNRQIVKIIVENSHLILEDEMPYCLANFIAHHEGYELLIRKWQLGDFSESTSFMEYPDDLYDYSERSYKILIKEQRKIMKQQGKIYEEN